MKQLKLFVILFTLTLGAYAQVGVNTTEPKTTFDIIAKNPTGTDNNVDGFLPPKVDRERMRFMQNIPTGTIVYCDNSNSGLAIGSTINVTQVGYYFYNGSIWEALVVKGVPAGGNAGQVLAKANSTDYNTQWVNAASIETNKEWAGNETIQFNDIRRILMCNVIVTMVNITAGTRTTAATFTASEANNWRYIGQANIATIAYPANAIVLNNVQWRSNIDGRIWRRDAVSGQVSATQDATEMAKWQAVTEVSRTWTAGAWIENDQIFDTAIGGNAALIRYIGSAKLATDITNDAINYETISTYNIGQWAANTGYPKHHVVSYEGSNYKRLAGGTSAATFVADAPNWSLMDGDIKPWQANTRLRDGQIVSHVIGGVTVYLRNINNRQTATSFTLAEAGNLSYISQNRIPATYPALQVVVNGFKFSIGEGGNVYRFNNGSWTTGASFPDNPSVQYVLEGSGAGIVYTPSLSAAVVSPYTMSIAKSAAGAFDFYEDAEMRFSMDASNRFLVLSKTTQAVTVWGVEDDAVAVQTGITATNAPVFEASHVASVNNPANTWVLRGNKSILGGSDDFGVYHVAPSGSGSFYRITIHGAGGVRNYVIERWRMGSVNLNSKVTLGY